MAVNTRMLSKLMPGRNHRRADGWRSSDRALNAGLGLYVFICCALVGWFAFAFYQVMQPTQYANPGIGAYEPPSTASIGGVREVQSRSEADPGTAAVVTGEIEPEAKTVGETTPKPEAAKKIDQAPGPAALKRRRVAQPRERDATAAYAYRPWGGNQSWSNNQSWNSNRSWNNNQSWGSYRSWDQPQSGPRSRH